MLLPEEVGVLTSTFSEGGEHSGTGLLDAAPETVECFEETSSDFLFGTCSTC